MLAGELYCSPFCLDFPLYIFLVECFDFVNSSVAFCIVVYILR